MTLTSEPTTGDGRAWLWPAAIIGLVLLAVVGAIVWFLLTRDVDSADRRTVIQEITLVTPPPPPPPPEPEEIVEKEEIVEPLEEPTLQDEAPSEDVSDDPTPSTDAAGLDAPADVGSDSFRLAAGKGGGFFGSGGGGRGGEWGSFLEAYVRRALQRDPRTRSAEGFVKVSVTVDPNGRFVGAGLRSTTGDPKLDAAIRDVLVNLPPLGRGRPADVAAVSVLTLNMKRGGG